MATNRQVRERLALKRDGPAPGLVQRMMQRNDQESADSATAAAEAKESESTSSAVEDQESASACAAEDATRHVDGGSSEEEGEVRTTYGGTAEDWEAFNESREQRELVMLDPFERMSSEHVVSLLRTEEERDAAMAVAASEPTVVTNHESGLEPIVSCERTYSLRSMPPASEWPSGNTRTALLAQARVRFEDYDHSFLEDRERRLCDERGVPRVHPIPVVLRDGETEAEYEAAFVASITKARTRNDGVRRVVKEDAQGQRSQRIQFAVMRMREWRARTGAPQPPMRAQAQQRAARRRATAETSLSPPPAPQRQRQDPERPLGGVPQAPMSTARTHATSPRSACGHADALSAASAPRGSVARRDDPSAALEVHAHAAPTAGSQEMLVALCTQTLRTVGALESQMASMKEELAALRRSHDALETQVYQLRESGAEEYQRSKHFYARYAPRVKALWGHQHVVDDYAQVPEETRLSDWDDGPQ